MKFNRTSTKYFEVKDKVSKGSLKAAYILTYQNSVGFDDGKHNLYGAYKLENIAVQEKLPDSFFPLSIISNTGEVQYALVKKGLAFTVIQHSKRIHEKFLAKWQGKNFIN